MRLTSVKWHTFSCVLYNLMGNCFNYNSNSVYNFIQISTYFWKSAHTCRLPTWNSRPGTLSFIVIIMTAQKCKTSQSTLHWWQDCIKNIKSKVKLINQAHTCPRTASSWVSIWLQQTLKRRNLKGIYTHILQPLSCLT